MWLLAEKLKAKGFPNLFDYYSKEFKDPETGKAADQRAGVHRDRRQDHQRADVDAQGAAQGRAKIEGWADFRKKGMFSGPKYTLKKGWGGKFATATKKFEFYSETLKKGLLEHAKKYETTTDDILAVSGYVARGELAFVPHYEPPKRHGSVAGVPVRLHRLQVAPEPRGPLGQPALVPGVQEGRSGRRLVGRRAEDEPGRRREAGPEDRRHREGHLDGRLDRHQAQAVGRRAARHRRQVLRPGPLGLRPRRREGLRARRCRAAATTTRSWSTTTTA